MEAIDFSQFHELAEQFKGKSLEVDMQAGGSLLSLLYSMEIKGGDLSASQAPRPGADIAWYGRDDCRRHSADLPEDYDGLADPDEEDAR